MPEEVYYSPSAPRSRDISPKTNELWCAWCTENGRVHKHSTANCVMLKNAIANDQWKVINKHKVCDIAVSKAITGNISLTKSRNVATNVEIHIIQT